jgi:xanthine dehydrogenase iron-sulfur cluster and FAD-binding subunit A
MLSLPLYQSFHSKLLFLVNIAHIANLRDLQYSFQERASLYLSAGWGYGKCFQILEELISSLEEIVYHFHSSF